MAIGKKTGGRTKGVKNKMSMAEAAIGDAMSDSNDPLKLLLEWISMLAKQFKEKTISSDDEKIFAELIKMGLPYTSRKMPVSVETKDISAIESASEEELLQRLNEIEIESGIGSNKKS